MPSKNLLEAVASVNNLEQKKAELRAKYKMEVQRIQDAASAVTRKLDTARTHAVMSSAPNLVKALGLSPLLNITLASIQENPELQERLSNASSFDAVFDDFTFAMNCVADYLYKHDEITMQISKFVEDELKIKHGKID